MSSTGFFYFEDFSFALDAKRFTFFMPEQVSSEDDLLNAFYEGMCFPGYFGFNYNALIDCLSNLDWCDCPHLRVVHFSLPSIELRALAVYISSLQAVIERYAGDGEHEFAVWFPASVEEAVESFRWSES